MSEWFDDLSKGLAAGQSRRAALGLLGRGVVGAALTSLLPGRVLAAGGGNSDCAHFCNDVFPPGPDRGKCKSDGAQGNGLCTTACGPGGTGGLVVHGICFPSCTSPAVCVPCAGTPFGCICEVSAEGTSVTHACIANACSAQPCSSSTDCALGNVCVHAVGCGGLLTCQPACPCS